MFCDTFTVPSVGSVRLLLYIGLGGSAEIARLKTSLMRWIRIEDVHFSCLKCSLLGEIDPSFSNESNA